MITQIDILSAKGEDYCYILGECGVVKIEESSYFLIGNPYPCFKVHLENGTCIEIRTVHMCNIHKKSGGE